MVHLFCLLKARGDNEFKSWTKITIRKALAETIRRLLKIIVDGEENQS
ncbi:hypothetical protein REC12_19070 [Desulfosporosinus sp. PR]|nr:hypothetical protein [Desulfosporosinus sp. PR]MDQ7095695.1 hypothetical protein [Desulfosporosinus sp. PR]